MEIEYISIAAFSSCFISLLILAWKVFNWVWLTPKKMEKRFRDGGLRANPYRLLVSDIKEISTLIKEAKSKPINLSDDFVQRVIPQFHNAIKKYGKITCLWLGPKPNVLIMDPELFKDVAQNINLFQKPHSLSPMSRYILPGLISYNGDKWTKHKKLINPAFHLEKLKHMLPSFYTSSSEMLNKWEQIISPQGSCELDVCPYLQTLSFDAISRTAFGSNHEEGRRIFQLQSELAEHFVKASQKLFIPYSRFLPDKGIRRMEQILRDVDDSIEKIISARLGTIKAGKGSANDLLGILLDSNSKEIDDHANKDFGMSIKEIIDECKLFYYAGYETTSALLVWTMVLLSRYPNWQALAREEVLQVFGTNKPDFDGLNRLKYVTMILNEVLRLYPPVAVFSRKVAEETKLGNISLPADTLITLPILLLHYDPEIWGDDVKDFKPERFEEGISNATKGIVSFFPFGWGPRTCVGQNFALMEAKLVLVMILQCFSFELSPSYSHAPYLSLTIKLQYGAHLILHKL